MNLPTAEQFSKGLFEGSKGTRCTIDRYIETGRTYPVSDPLPDESRARRATAIVVIDVWRSVNSNKRAGMVT